MIKEGKKRITITLTKEGFEFLLDLIKNDPWECTKSGYIDYLLRKEYHTWEKRLAEYDKQK